jgi:hypothetical protein
MAELADRGVVRLAPIQGQQNIVVLFTQSIQFHDPGRFDDFLCPIFFKKLSAKNLDGTVCASVHVRGRNWMVISVKNSEAGLYS